MESQCLHVGKDLRYMSLCTQMLMNVWRRRHVVTVYVITKMVDIHVVVMMVISCQEIIALVKVRILVDIRSRFLPDEKNVGTGSSFEMEPELHASM